MPILGGARAVLEGAANSLTSAASTALVTWASRAQCPDCEPVVNCDCPGCPAVHCDCPTLPDVTCGDRVVTEDPRWFTVSGLVWWGVLLVTVDLEGDALFPLDF